MNNNRKMKKFRKKKMLPPLLLLVIGFMIVMCADIFTTYMYVNNTINTKINANDKVGKVYAGIIENDLENDNGDNSLISSDNKLKDISFQVNDLDGKTVYGSEKNKKLKIATFGEITLAVPDKGNDCIISSENGDIKVTTDRNKTINLDVDYIGLIDKALKYASNDKDEVVTSIDIWNVYKCNIDNKGEYMIYVGEPIIVKSSDIIYVLELCALYLIIAIILGLVFIGNIIAAIISNNKMMAALYFDDKTGNSNWLCFKNRANKILWINTVGRKYMRSRISYALVCANNEKYDNYCTCFGGDIADATVVKMDKAIRESISKREACARNVDSYFGILVEYANEEELQKKVSDLYSKISEDKENNNIKLGIYRIPDDGKVDGNDEEQWSDVVDHYFHHARIACDTGNAGTKEKIVFFDEKLLEEHLWEHKVESKMETALINEDFKVYLQPKYDPKTKELKGAEALVRWVDEEDGFISPGRFIPIFEKNGFITKLDDYMISHVAKYQKEWIDTGYKVVPVSVNVSRAHFTQSNLAEHITKLIDEYNTPHDVIELELTESAFFDDKRTLVDTINKMQEAGFHVSMDDFGSGYSSLNSLKDLPLNVLKIDAEFFRGSEDDNRGLVIVSKAIELAKDLEMETVAEGVEKAEQVEFLAGAGCDMIQGFYFDKPMPAKEYLTRMSKTE